MKKMVYLIPMKVALLHEKKATERIRDKARNPKLRNADLVVLK